MTTQGTAEQIWVYIITVTMTKSGKALELCGESVPTGGSLDSQCSHGRTEGSLKIFWRQTRCLRFQVCLPKICCDRSEFRNTPYNPLLGTLSPNNPAACTTLYPRLYNNPTHCVGYSHWHTWFTEPMFHPQIIMETLVWDCQVHIF